MDMDKPSTEHHDIKSSSFSRKNSRRKSNDNAAPKRELHPSSESDIAAVNDNSHNHTHSHSHSQQCDQDSTLHEPPISTDLCLHQVLEEVDQFLQTLGNTQYQDQDPPQIPTSVPLLAQLLDSMIDIYNEGRTTARFGIDPPEDRWTFLHSVNAISKLASALAGFPSNVAGAASSLNQTTSVLHKAMSVLDEEFRLLLEEDPKSRTSSEQQKTPKKMTKQFSSLNSNIQQSDRCILPDPDSTSAHDDPEEFPPESVANMNKIASAMIAAGYDQECCLVFSYFRRRSFESAMQKLWYENMTIDDVHRMPWESLQGEIGTWISVVKHCTTVLLPNERRLCDSVFSNHPSTSQILFSDLAQAVIIRFLNFANAIVLTNRSAEKLFKFLDMYETVQDLERSIDDKYPEGCFNNLEYETTVVKDRLGEASASIFSDLEDSIKSDNGRIPVPGGAVHPLTRYVMNYLKYACEYKDTLEDVFRRHLKFKIKTAAIQEKEEKNEDGRPRTSPFAVQLMTVMDLLDENLDTKSNLYRDPSLKYIFLMNNGRYIVKKVKGSTEIHESVGDNWCRKRSTSLRQYHKHYQRETWGKVLHCLSHEGLEARGSNKVSKTVVKERFRSFNAMFEEIHRTQSTWMVSDEQLQSELRVSISAVMIPAYRSFVGRFKQYLDQVKQAEKYIKYQAEDIENLIDEFFDGNPTSMVRKRT